MGPRNAGVAGAASAAFLVLAFALWRQRRRRRQRSEEPEDDGLVRVLCYGDSNTWGFDSFDRKKKDDLEPRFDEPTRWPSVTGAALGPAYLVIESGLNGRTTNMDDDTDSDTRQEDRNGLRCLDAELARHSPHVVVVMLGTNDLKHQFARSPKEIAKGAAEVAAAALATGVAVLLVAPPIVWDKREWGFTEARRKSMLCAPHFKAEADKLKCDFLDAGRVLAIPDPAKYGGDGIHLSPQNCATLGAAVATKLRTMLAKDDAPSHIATTAVVSPSRR